jgi:hypothetical protein
MKTRAEIVAWVASEIASAHDVHEHIEMAYRLGYIKGQNDKESEMESEPTDARRAHLDELDDAPEKPALSRFLPRRPDDVPVLPDGWVYVGKGVDNKFLASSEHIGLLTGEGWCCGEMARCGNGLHQHYAISWIAPADVWDRFGLLAPSEGGGWIPHTPFTPKPDYADAKSDVLMDMRSGEQVACFFPTNDWQIFPVIGWRPALAEVRS